MKKFIGPVCAFTLCLGLSGCGGNEGGTAIDDAEQSAVEAYQAAEAEEQAQLDAEMSAGLEAEGAAGAAGAAGAEGTE